MVMTNLSIRTRTLLVALVPLTLSVVLLTWYYTHTRVQDFDLELRQKGHAIAHQLAPACEYGVVTGNRGILNGLAQAAATEPDVQAVIITDARGDVLASSDHTGSTGRFPHALTFRSPIYQSEIRINDIPDLDGPSAAAADTGRARPIGWVEVILSNDRTHARQLRAIRDSLILSFGGLLLSILLALRMSRSITQPVRRLTDAVDAIKNGHLDQRLVEAASGELGRLEQGINAMTVALQQSKQQERKLAEDLLYQERSRARVTLEAIGEGVLSTDARGTVVYMNPAAERYTGWSAEDALGMALNDILVICDEEAAEPKPYPIGACLDHGNTLREDHYRYLLKRNGERVPIRDTAAPIRDQDGSIAGAVIVLHDVTELQHTTTRIAYLASHDPLTGLLNRSEFETQLETLLHSAAADSTEHALCFVDLDHFKDINDTWGHQAGDEVLREVARRLQQGVRQSDLVARLGGDEFGVILTNCSIEAAATIATGMLKALAASRIAWQDRQFDVRGCAGVAPLTSTTESAEALMTVADTACYRAKKAGRDQVQVLTPENMHEAAEAKADQWSTRLRTAVAESRFELHHQRIVRANNGHPAHASELLLRLPEPDGSLTAAGLFLPQAERHRLLPEIDRWVLGRATELIASASSITSASSLPLFINLGAQTVVQNDFVTHIREALNRTGVKAANLCFEVPEAALLTHYEETTAFIAGTRALGCKVAIDDFGSRLTPLACLRDLEVDYVKLAQSLLAGIPGDRVDEAMVRSIAQIARARGVYTVAGYVESEAALRELDRLGIDFVQGYWLEAPKPFAVVSGTAQTEGDGNQDTG
jgi:diguanylate cyclase (GGDEF)-like protein/PAS domain S-box-containing protein